MRLNPLFLFVSLSTAIAVQDQFVLPINSNPALDRIREALLQASIIPDTPPDFSPKCVLGVTYTEPHQIVWLGNTIEPSHAREAPAVRILCPYPPGVSGARTAGDDDGSFRIALTDPDAPSRKDPTWSEFCHWIATVEGPKRCPVEKWKLNEEYLKDIVEYKPPAPPAKTGLHRYASVLLEGPNSNLTAPQGHKHWGTGKERHGVWDWAKKEELKVVGANFFYAQHEEQ